MTALRVEIETTGLQRVAENLTRVTPQRIGQLALPAVNRVAQRGQDESVRRMLSRYNLSEDYIRDRMLVEAANDPRSPEAVIVALRRGGRRPGIRPTNLRQYGAVQVQAPVNWNNSDPRIVKGDWGKNPRKPGAYLKWKRRTGAPLLGIPVNQKQAGISVEVIRGQRQTLTSAFMQRVRGGQTLVMARKRPAGSGKGKIEALYSQSVWQMFRRVSAQIIPIVRDDLEREVTGAVLDEIAQEIAR